MHVPKAHEDLDKTRIKFFE